MKVINVPVDFISKALGIQTINGKENFCPFLYTHSCKVDEGYLLYNLMTKEMLLLDTVEYESFLQCDVSSECGKILAEKWFLVPESNNDYLLETQMFDLFDFSSRYKKHIETFIIFTTTDCNARCFYCFEHGCKKIDMTPQTAHDVAQFIKRKSNGKFASLIWFGGEPLYNSEAMDIICNDLKAMDIDYNSIIATNAYLLDEKNVKKCKDLWKMSYVQITLDGTEKIYNRIKAYIYKDIASPFERVMQNIGLLLQNGIYVKIRLNMNVENCNDLIELSKYLYTRFGNDKNLSVYVSLIKNFKNGIRIDWTPSEKKELGDCIEQLNGAIALNNFSEKEDMTNFRKINNCMAANDGSVMILPDGKLGKCEHFVNDHFFGSIYSDEYDTDMIESFRKKGVICDKCPSCPFMPSCRSLLICSDRPLSCEDFEAEDVKLSFENRMKNSYMKYLQNGFDFSKETDNEPAANICD